MNPTIAVWIYIGTALAILCLLTWALCQSSSKETTVEHAEAARLQRAKERAEQRAEQVGGEVEDWLRLRERV